MELNTVKAKDYGAAKKDEKCDEDVFDSTVGNVGKWQIFTTIMVCLVKLQVAWHQLGIIFLAPPSAFQCQDSDYPENKCISNCTSYEYNKTTFQNTIIMDWDLVCERAWLKDFTQTIFMFGILVGNMTFGVLSDRFGRRWSLISSILLQAAIGSATIFSKDIYTFTFLRFLVAVSTGGTMVTSFVIVMELFGASYRYTMGILYQLPFVVGHMLLAFIGYFSAESWRNLQLFISAPSFLFVVFYWCVPESPRWLLANGNVDKAAKILKRGAKINGRPVDDIDAKLKSYKTAIITHESATKLFSVAKWRWMTLNISYVWFACALCFFGVSQYVGQLGGEIFTNVAISGAIQIPGIPLTIILNKYLGRRMTLVLSMALAGVSLLVSSFFGPELQTLKVSLACIALLGMSVSFPTAYIFAGELFPTTVRNSGVGICSFISRVGSMIAPFVAALSQYGNWMPTVIFSVAPLTSILSILALPETHKKPLADAMY